MSARQKAGCLSIWNAGCHAVFPGKKVLSSAKGRRLTTNLSSAIPQNQFSKACVPADFPRENSATFYPVDGSKLPSQSPERRPVEQVTMDA
jgi:hypothetical protein